MSNYSMKVIPKPEEGTAAVLNSPQKGKVPIFKDIASDNYLCGACRNIICQNVNRGQLINLVFICPKCGSYNFLKGV